MLFGARMDGAAYGNPTQDAPWSDVTWNQFETNVGKKVSIVHFGQPPPWKQAFAASPFQKCAARNAFPLCSMDNGGVSLSDIAAGKQNAAITAWAQKAKAYAQPIYLRFLWEMNGTWYAWGQQARDNPTLYKQAFQQFFKVIKSAGATNVKSVWCVNAIYPGSTPLANLYPGDYYTDVIGIDGYNWGPNKGGWKSFGEVFAPTYLELKNTVKVPASKPIWICEVASTEGGGSKAAWITDMLTTLPVYERIKAFCWFNWPIVEGGRTWDWTVETSTSSLQAFRDGIASPYYV